MLNVIVMENMLEICPIAGKDWCRQVHLTIALYYGI